MTRRAALLLRDGEYVNLGLGLPTLLSNHLAAARDIVLHSENGMLGFGPLVEDGEEDVDLYNASGQLVSLLPGASFFDSLYAHGMARGGRVTTVVLGAFQVSEKGDLANWNVPASGKGGIGGAMDLAAGRARVLVVTYHTTRALEPKLVRQCTYPLTAPACVRDIVTDLAYLTVEPEGSLLREPARGAQPRGPRGNRHVRLRRRGLRALRGRLPACRAGLWRAPPPAGGLGGRHPDLPQERSRDPRASIQPAAGGAHLARHGGPQR